MPPSDDIIWANSPKPRGPETEWGRCETPMEQDDEVSLSIGKEGTHVVLEPLSTEVKPARQVTKAIQRAKDREIQGKRFLELVRKGEDPGNAARSVGTTLKSMMHRSEIVEKIQQLSEKYSQFSPEDDKKLVRMKRRELLMEADDPKVQLEAAKQIASDPEVGLGSNAPTVLIDQRQVPPGFEQLLKQFQGEESGE